MGGGFKTGTAFLSAARIWSALFHVPIPKNNGEKNGSPLGKIVLPGPYEYEKQIFRKAGQISMSSIVLTQRAVYMPDDMPALAEFVCWLALSRSDRHVLALRCCFEQGLWAVL